MIRSRAAATLTRSVNRVSRALRLGSGTVIGGRAGLLLDHDLLAHLAAGRRVGLVSGTNGKTTTTRFLTAAVGTTGTVITNQTGSNMPAGHVAALAAARADTASPAVLEVDEAYVPQLVRTLVPTVLVLLNLSRDQLDRTNEVRMTARRWREALDGATVVANADDPLVVFAAQRAARVVWVAAGMAWRFDAVGCPACEERITYVDGDWSCECGFTRPTPDVEVDADELALAIPGRFNAANATMALAAAEILGVARPDALAAMRTVTEVAGRFRSCDIDGVHTRLLLAKNPAGWSELLELVSVGDEPVVVAINARIADGKDPSWLWDVPFERLRGRRVVATGERCLDLSVRLDYAEVSHRTERRPHRAIRLASDGAPVEFIGNYTAFADMLR